MNTTAIWGLCVGAVVLVWAIVARARKEYQKENMRRRSLEIENERLRTERKALGQTVSEQLSDLNALRAARSKLRN